MSFLLSSTTIDAGFPDVDDVEIDARPASRPGEVLRPTLPTPLSALIATIFGDAKSTSREPVLFTAAERGAGVTWTASAVAAELGASGRKVLLADARLIAALSQREDVVALCDRVGPDKVWVLGEEQAEQTQFPMSSRRGRPSATLAALRLEFPFILLDAPALSESDVALRLAASTSGAVLVIRKDATETRVVMDACRKFATVGGHVLGCVYNAHAIR